MNDYAISAVKQFLDINTDKLSNCGDKKLYIWGTGTGGRLLAEEMASRKIEVDGFIDNDKSKEGSVFFDMPIVFPDSLNYKKDGFLVLIGSGSFEKEIRAQLIGMGADRKDILSPYSWALTQFALIITNICNLSCEWCAYNKNFEKLSDIQHSGKDEISVEDAKHIMDILVENGYSRYLQLSGGEPLLHKSFRDIFDYAADRFNETAIQTNGVLLNDELINYLICKAEGLKNTERKITVYVSLTGYTEQVYKLNQGYGKKHCGILLERLNKSILNLLYKRDERALGEKLGVNLRYLINEDALDFCDLRSYLDFWGKKVGLIDLNKKFDENMSRGHENKCPSGCIILGSHAIYPNGDVAMCCHPHGLEHKLGNMLENFEGFKLAHMSFMDNMTSHDMERTPELCKTCGALHSNYADVPFYNEEIGDYLEREEYIKGEILKAKKICLFGVTGYTAAFYLALRMWGILDGLQIIVIDYDKEGFFDRHVIQHCDKADYEDYLICSFDNYHLTKTINNKKLTNRVIDMLPKEQ